MVVVVLCAITLLVLASALQWTTTNTRLSARNNEYFQTVAVAEGATENVLSRMMADYRKSGESWVLQNLDNYRSYLPTTNNAILSDYEFNDGQGTVGKVFVECNSPAVFTNLNGQYKDLRGYVSPVRVISNARKLNSLYKITGAVRQDFQMATIPIFQFAIFYNVDLEINPGPDMEITGPVHCNEDIYLCPGKNLTFWSDLTSANDPGIILNRKDSACPGNGTVNYYGKHEGKASTLNLPIGTNNTPAAVREVVEPPPAGESATSDIGKERFYNKADMIIRIRSTGQFTVSSGLVDNFATVIPRKLWDAQSNQVNGGIGFVTTNVSFYNKRENKTIIPIQIDVAQLLAWNSYATNALRPLLTNTVAAGNITVIYVLDQRALNSSTETGVRLVNGETLLPKGLTVATPNPVYIWGDYNAPTNAPPGSTNTSATKPAAIIGDAITILSDDWKDKDQFGGIISDLTSRKAKHTTVNAAFLAGIVETTNSVYSGGVENFPRFLEDWGGQKFTYNGSMVVMFPSKYATGAWADPGDDFGVYNAPTRLWAFDQNFYRYDKLPPATPMIRTLVRSTWTMIKPNTTVVAGP